MADAAHAGVIVYTSEVSGNLATKKHQAQLELFLNNAKIPFKKVDVSVEAGEKDFMIKTSGKRELPQVFVNGQFKGLFDEVEGHNEDGDLKEWLGV